MIKSIKIAAMVVASAVLAGASIADVVAGWDFSQYSAPGTLNTGSGFVKTLSANYTPGGGSGTMYLDGSNGSTNVGANEATAYAVVSREARYASNMDANEDFQGFDSTRVGVTQTNFNPMAIATDTASADIVFEADKGAPGGTWALSMSGFAANGFANVGIEIAPACGAYSSVGSVALVGEPEAIQLPLTAASVSSVCVRLSLDNRNGQAVIDNVAVPEPGLASLLVAGVLGLVALGRIRRVL